MSKKTIIACLLLVGGINSLYAVNLIKNITQPKSVLKNVRNNESDQSYADFSGTWTSSKCMGHPVTLNIENSSNYLVINDEVSLIGTMNSTANSGIKASIPTPSTGDISSVEWNTNKTQLIIKSIRVEKAFEDQDNPGNSVDTSMFLIMNQSTFELENEQLKLKMNTAEFKDLQRVDVSHPTCVFTKSN
jgi:hypothetical protein